MRTWEKWLFVTAGLAAVLVAVSAVVQAVRLGSWSPIVSMSWLLAVLAATLSGTAGRCRSHRRNDPVNPPAG